MRWKAEPIPKDGDMRTRRVFALFPTRVGDEWVWLEYYEVVEVYGWDAIRGGWDWHHRRNIPRPAPPSLPSRSSRPLDD